MSERKTKDDPDPEKTKSSPQRILAVESLHADADVEPELETLQSYYLEGWRLQSLIVGLCLSLFLASIEGTIVSTALVSITDDLQGFERASWIVTAYLITFTGFLVIIARLSDIFGRKTMISSSIVVLIAFSLGSGLSHNITELIIVRAFQGIGGGGIYTMTFIILPEAVKPSDYPKYAAIIGAVLACSNLLGPILGGAICSNGDWRWVFFLNAPIGAVALVLIFFSLPSTPESASQEGFTRRIRNFDYVGAFLVLGASTLLVTALEEGGTGSAWNSALVLPLLILAICMFVGRLLWSRYLHHSQKADTAMLSWKLFTDRFALGLFLNSLFAGSVVFAVVVSLPQHSQVLYRDSPAKAGYRLLSLTLVSALFSGISGSLTQKLHIPPLYTLLAGSSLLTLGCGLSSTLTNANSSYPASQYGFEAIIGAGVGICLSTVIIAAPLAFTKQELAFGMGTTNQARNLGGCIGVSICANITTSTLFSRLSGVLPEPTFKMLLRSAGVVDTLTPEVKEQVRRAFAVSFTRQMQACTVLGGAAVLGTLVMIEKRPRSLRG